MAIKETLNIKPGSRVFVVGDIHGCYDRLIEELTDNGFDFENDTMVCTGDLIDRGPDSKKVVDACRNEKWFKSVKGNHDVMPALALLDMNAWLNLWMMNGGQWATYLSSEDLRELASTLEALPNKIEFNSTVGKVGVIHASVPNNDWLDDDPELFQNTDTSGPLWNRNDFHNSKLPVKNVDLVVHGHTIVENQVSIANRSYIDCGLYSANKLGIMIFHSPKKGLQND